METKRNTAHFFGELEQFLNLHCHWSNYITYIVTSVLRSNINHKLKFKLRLVPSLLNLVMLGQITYHTISKLHTIPLATTCFVVQIIVKVCRSILTETTVGLTQKKSNTTRCCFNPSTSTTCAVHQKGASYISMCAHSISTRGRDLW